MNLSRRSFFSGAALLAVADLPAANFLGKAGEERPSRHSAISPAFAVVRLGLKKPFSVLHISDTHLTDTFEDEHPDKRSNTLKRGKAFGSQQEESLFYSLEYAKGNCDFVLHTGDLVDFKSKANFELVKKYLGENMFCSMGNHEFYEYTKDSPCKDTEEYKRESYPVLGETFKTNPRMAAKEVNGVNFVALDNVFGYVAEDQVEFFKAEVAKGLPIALCMHVPIFTRDVDAVSWKFWKKFGRRFTGDRKEEPKKGSLFRQKSDPTTVKFIEYLKGEKLLKAIFTGHEHLTFEERFSPSAVQYLVGGNYRFAARDIMFI